MRRSERARTSEPGDLTTREVEINEVQTVEVLIVDDQPPVRAVARTVVGMTDGFEVVGEAETGEAAVDAVAALRPALVLMDINLPGISGIEATRRIVAAAPGIVVVLLSTYDAASLPSDALTSGAVRYVHKEDLGPDVLDDVWSTARG